MNNTNKETGLQGCYSGDGFAPCGACGEWSKHLSSEVLARAIQNGTLPKILKTQRLCANLEMRIVSYQKTATTKSTATWSKE